MNILALENSTQNLSIALQKANKILEYNKLKPRASEEIIPAIDRILKKARLKIRGIDLFSLGLGPGSFTSLRIGVSIIKGFSLALKKPVIGIPSFLAIAAEVGILGKNTVILADARKDLIYGAIYKKTQDRLTPYIKERLISLDEFLEKFCDNNCIFAGESVKFKEQIHRLYPDAIVIDRVIVPKAKYLLDEALRQSRRKHFTPLERLEPLYLHPQDCQVRKP